MVLNLKFFITSDKIYPKGVVTLTIIAKTYPTQISKEIDFLVMDCPSTYNMIIGRPTLNRLKATTSTYCLKVKFPIAYGVGEIQGDQVLPKECYQAALASGENHLWTINEDNSTPNVAEELETIEIIPGDPTKVKKIGTKLPHDKKEGLVKFLKENQDVFAWSHEKILGIDTTIIQHCLNIDPAYKPIQQRRRIFTLNHNQAVIEQVEKLLVAGFIREVYYPK